MHIKQVILRLIAFMPAYVLALPEGADLISGSATFSVGEPGEMVIEVADRSIIAYDSFSVEASEKVVFVQPSEQATVLNRVVGGNQSDILGKMEANGRVFLVNERGIFFGRESVVDMGALVVSTLAISDLDFTEDRYEFFLNSYEGSIVNKGYLLAKDSITILSSEIVNEGIIAAEAGHVLLAAGERVTLHFEKEGLVRFLVEGELEKALIEQAGSIEALKGDVYLEMSSVRSAIEAVINTEGIEVAAEIEEESGKIFLTKGSKTKGEIVSAVSKDGATQVYEGEVEGAELLMQGKNIEGSHAFFLAEESASFTTSNLLLDENTKVTAENKDILLSATALLELKGEVSAKKGEVFLQGAGDVLWTDGTVFAKDLRVSAKELLIAEEGSITPKALANTFANVQLTASNGKITVGGLIELKEKGAFLSLEGEEIHLLSSISTRGGGIFLTGDNPICYLEENSLFDTTDGGSYPSGGDIVIPGKVEGEYKLTLEGGKLGEVDIGQKGKNEQIDLASILMKGSNIRLHTNIEASGGTIIFQGPVTLTDDVILVDRGPTGVVFQKEVVSDGPLPHSLTVSAFRGRIAFLEGAGGINKLHDLTLLSEDIQMQGDILLAGEFDARGEISLVGDLFIESPNITVNGTIDGPYSLTINGGDIGSIILAHDIGKNVRLREVTLENFSIFRSQGIFARAIIQESGTAAYYNGTLDASGSDGISLRGDAMNFKGEIRTTGGGDVVISNEGDMTAENLLNMFLSGNFTQVGTGDVNIHGSIQTSGKDVTFNGSVLLTDDLSINTGGGRGDVVFNNTVDGEYDLTLSLQIGDLVFDGAVGFSLPVGTVLIKDARHVEGKRIHASNFIQEKGYGLATYLEDITTTGRIGIDLTSNYLAFAGRTGGKSLRALGLGSIVLNAMYGSVGTVSNPVDVSLGGGTGFLFIGSGHPSYIVSIPSSVKVLGAVKTNMPCFIEYNGVKYAPRTRPVTF